MARFVHPCYQQSRELLRDSYVFATRHHVEFVGQASAAIQKEIDRHAASHTPTPRRDAAE